MYIRGITEIYHFISNIILDAEKNAQDEIDILDNFFGMYEPY